MNVDTDIVIKRLKQAQEETQVFLTIDGRPNIVEMNEVSPPDGCWDARRNIDRYLDEGTWKSTGPGFQGLQEWVALHWNPEDEKHAPNGTIATLDRWLRRGDVRLDAASATRKLIAAAKMYGSECVGKYAAEFAAHGMVEVRYIFLLKGPPIEAAKPLDEYCVLLPYREALRKIDTESDPELSGIILPEPHSENVCALEVRYFERDNPHDSERSQYTTPLLKDGPEQLALLLGLVWGSGFRVIGNWHTTPPAAEATLPYRHVITRGTASRLATLRVTGYGPPPWKRPLPVAELYSLATKYSDAPEEVRHKLRRAMARLRDNTERISGEDRAVDLGIALQVLFRDGDEAEHQIPLIRQRAAWYYADSEDERRRTEHMLARFFRLHSDIVRGCAFDAPNAYEPEQVAKLLSGTDDMLRANLKSIIAEGWPQDWDEAADPSAFRHDPPRPETEVPSAKSDSLSWSVDEQKEIDQTLVTVWEPIIEAAPLPPPGTGPLTAVGFAPEHVESYRKQGVSYVVVHPARLYMAHPKWPKAASEPLHERAEYYCALDVARHIQQWKEAALRKGLVVFEAPSEAVLYHPKNRDLWPQPLFSSHEENPSVHSVGQPAATGETASSDISMLATDTDHRRQTAAENQSDAPAAAFPDSVTTAFEREWPRLWRAFQHDVNVATNSLLYLLDAIHSIYLVEQRHVTQGMPGSSGALKTPEDAVRAPRNIYSIPSYSIPAYPKLRAFPELSGEPLFVRSAPGGPMEQTVFKGWIAEVHDRWESVYRTQLKHAVRDLPGAIRPRQQVLGDLRHIRNNLLHNGIAKNGEAASCEILRWFTEREPMQLRLRHVLDFLNQMGWLSENSPAFLEEQGKLSIWRINRAGKPEEPPPAIVSVRPLVEPEQPDPTHRVGASIVFENGVFGNTSFVPQKEETAAQAKKNARKWMKMTVNENGDIQVPGLGTASAVKLYWHHLKGEMRPGPGTRLPSVQFRTSGESGE